MAYIGTQSDKLPEAMAGMVDLLNNMPESDNLFASAKKATEEQIRTERITKSNILFNYMNAKKLGNNHDIRKDIYDALPTLTFENIKSFQQTRIKNKKYNIMVLGSKSNLDLKTLENYGEITYLTLSDIFGY